MNINNCLSMVCLWFLCGFFMVYLIVYLWFVHGLSMVDQWL